MGMWSGTVAGKHFSSLSPVIRYAHVRPENTVLLDQISIVGIDSG